MLALANGMDAVSFRQLRNFTACVGCPILLSNWMAAVQSQWMIALVNGMAALSYQKLRNLTACFGYLILLSHGMDAVKSPNPNVC